MMSGHIMDADAATEAAELSQHNEAEDAEDVSITDISLIQVSYYNSSSSSCLISSCAHSTAQELSVARDASTVCGRICTNSRYVS